MSPEGPPFILFSIWLNGCLKTLEGPIFRHYATYRRPKKKRKKIKKKSDFFQFFLHAGTEEKNT